MGWQNWARDSGVCLQFLVNFSIGYSLAGTGSFLPTPSLRSASPTISRPLAGSQES